MKQTTFERTFQSYYENVWEAFTDSDILKTWWAPKGMHCTHANMTLEVGGIFHYCFSTEDNLKNYWGRCMYQEISPETGLLSYWDSFADEEGNPVPPSTYGLPGDKIDELMVVFEFNDLDGTTEMKAILDNPYEGELAAQFRDGWNGMFDKLDHVLPKSV